MQATDEQVLELLDMISEDALIDDMDGREQALIALVRDWMSSLPEESDEVVAQTPPTLVHCWRFTNGAIDVPPNVLQGSTPVEWLKTRYSGGSVFGIEGLLNSGCYRLAGWQFDFRPWLKRYVVCQHDHWQAVYAPNRTLLRKSLHGRIQEITDAPI